MRWLQQRAHPSSTGHWGEEWDRGGVGWGVEVTTGATSNGFGCGNNATTQEAGVQANTHLLAVVAADAGHLGAAPGQLAEARLPAVLPHDAGFHGGADAGHAGFVGGEHGGG